MERSTCLRFPIVRMLREKLLAVFDTCVVDEWDDVLTRACLIRQRTRMTRHGKTLRRVEKDGIFRGVHSFDDVPFRTAKTVVMFRGPRGKY
jgi:hypothetical protein